MIKQQQFLALKQGRKTVTEYLHEFNFLARYAPDDVSTDARRQSHFMNGLTDEIQLALAVHEFRNFQHMVNKAIVVEHKSVAVEESKKRKKAAQSPASGSSSRQRTGPFQTSRYQAPVPPRYPAATPSPSLPAAQRNNGGKNSQNNGAYKPNVTCFHCGRQGHYASQCLAKQRGMPQTYRATTPTPAAARPSPPP